MLPNDEKYLFKDGVFGNSFYLQLRKVCDIKRVKILVNGGTLWNVTTRKLYCQIFRNFVFFEKFIASPS